MPSEDITASIKVEGTQQAVKDIQSVEKEGEKLSKQKITPQVATPASQIKATLDQLKASVTEAQKMAVAARALQDELGAALDPATAQRFVEVLAKGGTPLEEIAAKAGEIGGQLRQLSAETGTALTTMVGPARAGADEMAAGFEQAHESISRVVGDTTGQLLEMGGVAQQVSMPLAQLADSFANLVLRGEAGGGAISGLLKAAGPIAAITAVVGVATAAWEGYKRKQEEIKRQTEETTKALAQISGVTKAVDEELQKLGGAKTASFGEQLVAALAASDDKMAAVLGDANELKLSFSDLGVALAAFGAKGTGNFDALAANMQKNLGLTQDQVTQLIGALDQAPGSFELFLANIGPQFQGILSTTDLQNQALVDQLRLYFEIHKITTDEDVNKTAKTQLDRIRESTAGTEAYLEAKKNLAAQGIANPSDIVVLTETQRIMSQTVKTAEDYAKAIQDNAVAMHKWQLENRDIATELPTQWKIAKVAADKYRRGIELTGEEQQTLNALASAMGTDVRGVIGKATAAFDADTAAMKADGKAALQAAADRRKAIDQQEADNKRLVVSMEDAQAALADMGGAFNQMKDSGDALKTAFNLQNAPLDFLGRIRDIDNGMRDFAEFINDPKKGLGGKIPNIFDPNDIHAGDFLQKIKSLRDPIQQEIINAFSTGGIPAAQATAEQYVNELFAVLKGKLSKDQIRALLEVGDLNVTLKVAVDQKSKVEAEKELMILTGLQGGESPFTASINLALAAGTLSPQAAKILIERQLGKLGVEVPSTLATPDVGKAKSEADVFAVGHPVNMTSNIDMKQTSVLLARDAGQRYADDAPPIVFPSSVDTPRTPIKIPFEAVFPLAGTSGGRRPIFISDAGGTIPSGGVGLVAERRPEILNERWLATQPTFVPAGTRVTSGARTAHILRTRGTRGLRRYDAGGTVTAVPVNITINAAALGARYEIMRTVRNAAKDAARLLGTRP